MQRHTIYCFSLWLLLCHKLDGYLLSSGEMVTLASWLLAMAAEMWQCALTSPCSAAAARSSAALDAASNRKTLKNTHAWAIPLLHNYESES